MIRVAILGGGIGAKHLEGYAALDSFEVAMLVDRDAEVCARFARAGVMTASDIGSALEADVDVIDICLPPHLHAPVTIAALEAGKHVICEKPLATSMAQVASIRAAADAAGRSVFPVFQYRFGAALDRLAALREAGLTGDPVAAALETHWNRGADYYAVPWRGTWAGEQGGAVLGHAIHAHDLLQHTMASVEGVSAHLATTVNPIETEDTGALVFQLAGGALATSSITLGAATDETRLRLVYRDLTATSATNPYAPGEGDWTFIARDPARQAAVDRVLADVPTQPAGFAGFLAQVALAISGEPNRAVTLDEGAASIELVTAIYASHRAGGVPVALPLPEDHPLRDGWLP